MSKPLEIARELFSKLDKGNEFVDSLIKVTSKYKTSPIMLAYYGAAKTAKANYVSGLFDKYKTAKSGLNILNSSVLKSPKSLEVRFIRYSVELNIPAIMPFTDHTKEDKKFIIAFMDTKHPFYKQIRAFMLKYGDLSETEKKKFT